MLSDQVRWCSAPCGQGRGRGSVSLQHSPPHTRVRAPAVHTLLISFPAAAAAAVSVGRSAPMTATTAGSTGTASGTATVFIPSPMVTSTLGSMRTTYHRCVASAQRRGNWFLCSSGRPGPGSYSAQGSTGTTYCTCNRWRKGRAASRPNWYPGTERFGVRQTLMMNTGCNRRNAADITQGCHKEV